MPRTPHKHDIPPHKRVEIGLFLAGLSVDGRLPHGSKLLAMQTFAVSRSTVDNIWKLRSTPKALTAGRRPYAKRPRRFTVAELGQIIAAVPLCKRQTIRALAEATQIPCSTLHDYLKVKSFRRVISRVKPTLTDDHKSRRLSFALNHVQVPIFGIHQYRFDAMYDVVHIDETWFNMYKASDWYYLAADESLPYRSCSNKRYIGKVMFLAAVARPRYDFRRKRYFDGKIGIWPIVEHTVALRNSARRRAGTPITKSITMTRRVYVDMLKTKVFPAIRSSWPGRKKFPIRVQQDNADPHVDEDNGEHVAAGREGGWTIQMECQLPRSLDLNVLDLGGFNALQSLQYKNPTNDVDKLIGAVESAYSEIKSTTLDKGFLTLQKVMECIIEHKGGNDFKLPGVDKVAYRNGAAVTALQVSEKTYRAGVSALTQQILDQ